MFPQFDFGSERVLKNIYTQNAFQVKPSQIEQT